MWMWCYLCFKAGCLSLTIISMNVKYFGTKGEANFVIALMKMALFCRYHLKLKQTEIMQEIEEYLPSFFKWTEDFVRNPANQNKMQLKL